MSWVFYGGGRELGPRHSTKSVNHSPKHGGKISCILMLSHDSNKICLFVYLRVMFC